jgi:hypothetical protein
MTPTNIDEHYSGTGPAGMTGKNNHTQLGSDMSTSSLNNEKQPQKSKKEKPNKNKLSTITCDKNITQQSILSFMSTRNNLNMKHPLSQTSAQTHQETVPLKETTVEEATAKTTTLARTRLNSNKNLVTSTLIKVTNIPTKPARATKLCSQTSITTFVKCPITDKPPASQHILESIAPCDTFSAQSSYGLLSSIIP